MTDDLITIEYYKTTEGKQPFVKWYESLDKSMRIRIMSRITRLREKGGIGEYKPIGDGVFELKADFGPGYRLYFAYKNEKTLIFLFGGYKNSQSSDIKKAKEYWLDYSKNKGKIYGRI